MFSICDSRRWGLVILNPLNIIGSLWMKGPRWMWHLIQLKENNFLLKQLCVSAYQRDGLRQCVDRELRALWKTSGSCTFSFKHHKSSMKLFIEEFLSFRAFRVWTCAASSQLKWFQLHMIPWATTNKQKPLQLPSPLPSLLQCTVS